MACALPYAMFFDWKPDENTKTTFNKLGVYYAAAMKAFFVSTLY